MDDISRVAIDAETPVNPYSLLEAVNRSSGSANTAWLICIGLMSYLLITVAGISHKDLLLNSDISLPILQVKIELTRFFLFVPILLVLLHLGLIGQLALVARKTLEFAASIRMLETTDQRTHPLRLELDNFFFVQAIAGPDRSRLVSIVLHGMSWLTIVVMPVALLLYVQLVFLPYHDGTITWVHRSALIADIILLVCIGVFLWRLETSFFHAFLRTTLHHPFSLALTTVGLLAVGAFSLFFATVPEAIDQPSATGLRAAEGRYILGYAVPGTGASGDGTLLGLFHRNLNVTDTDLVVDRDVSPGETSINLRGRDLRFARLDRTDLHQADLTGADLDGASLIGADLRGISMGCADLNQLLLTDSHRSGRCASARGANFLKARLGDARMTGADLRAARLEEAQLEGAQLGHAAVSGANFAGARLDRADFSGASLHGANFILASLQGADLSGAKLQMSDFTNAAMQGANLSLANLEGASLRDVELEGANLQMARLYGAVMSGAKLQGSDLKGAYVWRSPAPTAESVTLADLGGIVLQPPTEDELTALGSWLTRLQIGGLKARLADSLVALADPAQIKAWGASADRAQWQGLARSSDASAADGYRVRLTTEYLARLMCRPRFASGAVATGVARRAMAAGFKGDVSAIYDKLKGADCPAASSVSPPLMRELATAADAARESGTTSALPAPVLAPAPIPALPPQARAP
jgi:uncharacterized protein YjbI with pentapeptide repeats